MVKYLQILLCNESNANNVVEPRTREEKEKNEKEEKNGKKGKNYNEDENSERKNENEKDGMEEEVVVEKGVKEEEGEKKREKIQNSVSSSPDLQVKEVPLYTEHKSHELSSTLRHNHREALETSTHKSPVHPQHKSSFFFTTSEPNHASLKSCDDNHWSGTAVLLSNKEQTHNVSNDKRNKQDSVLETSGLQSCAFTYSCFVVNNRLA